MNSIQLSKSDTELFQVMATLISTVNKDKYYHIPQYFKVLGNDVYEVYYEDELPEDVKEYLGAIEYVKEKRKEISINDNGLEPEIRKH